MFEKDKKSFPQIEEEILEFWQSEKIFVKSLENRANAPHFSFYDGPPFATGLPHYGHLLASTIKDAVARFWTMQGYCVPRRFGWDCHGLPVENEIEKVHKFKSAKEIEDFGIGKFNEECRKIVLRFSEEWKSKINRIGRFVEFDNTYRTMDLSYMESVWWVFGELWKKGLVYEGYKVMAYSAKLGTPLSNFEANLNYREVDDPSLIVKVKLLNEDVYMLPWTTTPWTLPSNMALAVGKDISYVKVRDTLSNELYILAKERLDVLYKEKSDYEILDTFKGSDLEGIRYEPLFPYFADSENAFQILLGDFVKTGDGTGVVHMAPAFGEDDFSLCKDAGISSICPVDQNCRFTNEVPEYEGKFVKDADKEIIRAMKAKNQVLQHKTIRHRYPFCWRTDTPLIYRTISTWFVNVESIKDKLVANNQLINWVPEHIKDGRFGKWLENARDWAISRNRYWGTPIPIWRSEDGELLIISSIEELEEKTGEKVTDLHRHFIDHLKISYKGKVYSRVSEVFDCWFESGSMPYAQNHFPFENKESTQKNFPADFIAEGLDQTRGWFYTLNVLSTALFDQPAFKNVIVNGIILAEDGHKMSKSLKNFPEPELVINKFGADAVRLYMLHSPVVRADDFSFSENGVQGVLRSIILPLWNSYVFLATYAEIYEWVPTSDTFDRPNSDIDRWILSKLQKLTADVTEGMKAYQIDRAVEPMVEFIEDLTNWYIRRSRTRFWAAENTVDRREAFETLYSVLITLSKLCSPFIPFISEAIYQRLKREDSLESVHLHDFPEEDEILRDIQIEDQMNYTKLVVNLGRSLRKEHKLKTRQPLENAYVVSTDNAIIEFLKDQKHLIAEELNVREIIFTSKESDFVLIKTKPNFKTLGKKVGKKMAQVKMEIENLDSIQITTLQSQKTIVIDVEGESISLTDEDVLIEREALKGLVAACFGSVTIALDTHLSESLIQEGYAREIVNKINTMRKDAGFEVTDRIAIEMETPAEVEIAFHKYREYIVGEVLAKEVKFHRVSDGIEWDINGNLSKIKIHRF